MNRTKYLLAVGLAEVTAAVRRNNATLFGTRTLMYHNLGDDASCNDLYLLSSDSFRAQIEVISQWARNNRIPFVPLKAEPGSGIAVTFDDGYRSTLAIAAPLLVQHGIPFHVFTTRAYSQSGDARYLNETDLRELAALPDVVIGAHGTTHTQLAHMPLDILHRELLDAKDWLQQVIQRSVDSLSYPHGSFTSATTEAVQRCGYSYACSSQPGTFRSIEQRFSIPRIDIWSHDSVRTTLHKLQGAWDWIL